MRMPRRQPSPCRRSQNPIETASALPFPRRWGLTFTGGARGSRYLLVGSISTSTSTTAAGGTADQLVRPFCRHDAARVPSTSPFFAFPSTIRSRVAFATTVPSATGDAFGCAFQTSTMRAWPTRRAGPRQTSFARRSIQRRAATCRSARVVGIARPPGASNPPTRKGHAGPRKPPRSAG